MPQSVQVTTTLTSILVLSAIGIGSGLAAIAVARRAREARVARFDSRETLSVSELCGRYFPQLPQEAVTKCLSTISRITGIEAGRLRPNDRFDVELKLPRGNFIAGEWDDIEDEIAERSRKLGQQSSVQTVSDYVQLLAAGG